MCFWKDCILDEWWETIHGLICWKSSPPSNCHHIGIILLLCQVTQAECLSAQGCNWHHEIRTPEFLCCYRDIQTDEEVFKALRSYPKHPQTPFFNRIFLMSRLEGFVFGICRKIHSLKVREMVNKKNPLLNLPFCTESIRIIQNPSRWTLWIPSRWLKS